MTQQPAFEVVAGEPDDEELAAITVVLMALARRRAPAATPQTSGWAARWRSVGAAPSPGPGSWTARR